MPPQIEIKAGELTIFAKIEEVGSFQSRSTGKRLNLMKVQFRTDNETERELVQSFVGKGEPVETASQEPGVTRRWEIGDNSSSFTVGEDHTEFHWELREEEQFTLEKLILNNDLELAPYRYKEEFDNQSVLTIIARAELTSEQESKLRKLPEYFPVIRKGINDEAREMRFGEVLWSHDGEKYKMRMYIIDEADSEKGWGGLFQPQFRNVSVLAAENSLRMSALLELMLRRGMVTKEEREIVETIEPELLQRELLKRNRVNDLEEWLERTGEKD